MHATCRRVALAAVLLATAGAPARAEDYRGSRFAEVWAEVKSDPYRTLPMFRVTTASFFGFLEDKLLRDARRTLEDDNDLLPRFRKLLHPNGICLAGSWHITEATPYTGYFAEASEGLIIARASTALSEVLQGERRAFGLAGKLYPTTDRNHAEPLEPANFVVIEDLGGTLRDSYLDAAQSNDIIDISLTPASVFKGALALAVAQAFARADETLDATQTLIRQLYPIAELGGVDPAAARAPRWMYLRGARDTPRVDRRDFRDELRIEHYPDGITFDIFVADRGTRLGAKDWRRIGYIHFDDSVASDTCDRRLHFHHPRFR